MKTQTLTPQIESLINDFVGVLNEKATNFSYDEYRVQYGRKFAKVFMYQQGTRRGIHCFIDFTNGDVIKPATLNAPQKNADGTFSVRYNLVDPVSRGDLYERAEFSGGYLYAR